jgi:putative tryptophan/tyrosine transport system substrate-binding protein
MRRRDFIKVIGGGTVAWPLVARAQQATMPVIGFISGTWPDADRLPALRQGLKEIGYIEGENLIVTYGWAEGRFERLPAMIAELIRRQVAVIVPVGTPPTLAAVAATKTIPITFVIGDDPVRLGIVASLSRPGDTSPMRRRKRLKSGSPSSCRTRNTLATRTAAMRYTRSSLNS